jgi:CheY-like chemotaxis protein
VSANAAPSLAGHRILVVEDEELISLMLVDVLEDLGASVIGPAGSVSDALRLVGQSDATAALLDLSLKGETVYPVADRLVELGIPFVFITGYGQGHLVARHAQAPVLTKPFGPDQLAALFARVGWIPKA